VYNLSGGTAVGIEKLKTQLSPASKRAPGADQTTVSAHLNSIQAPAKANRRIQAHNVHVHGQ